MDYFEVAKPIAITASSGLILFAATKFYSGCMLLIKHDNFILNHENQIRDLVKATTVDLPKQMDNLKDEIIEAQTKGIDLFASEIVPLKKDVAEIRIDIFNLKAHTKYKNGHK